MSIPMDILFTCIFGKDWSKYETSVPKWHHRGEYKYEVAMMKQEDLYGLVHKVVLWIENKSDTSEHQKAASEPGDNGEEKHSMIHHAFY